MGRTIIQPIGPLYGEAVNGTVFGRPNGSIYIPETNQISFNKTIQYIKNKTGWGTSPYYITPTTETGTGELLYELVAKSQDNAAYMVVEVSDSSEFSGEGVELAMRTFGAGIFNSTSATVLAYGGLFAIEDGVTYYIRGRLVAASGVDVAVTETIEVTGVA